MSNNKSSSLKHKYLFNLDQGADASKYKFARKLRQKQTEAEQILWALLRNRQLNGKKFRRQHAIANYVADFYCHECKLVVELDGKFHLEAEAKEYDAIRTASLKDLGITVIRFWNNEIINDPQKVLQKIAEYLVVP